MKRWGEIFGARPTTHVKGSSFGSMLGISWIPNKPANPSRGSALTLDDVEETLAAVRSLVMRHQARL